MAQRDAAVRLFGRAPYRCQSTKSARDNKGTLAKAQVLEEAIKRVEEELGLGHLSA
jgi:hypothetical protein